MHVAHPNYSFCRIQEVSNNWQESKFLANNVAALSPEVKDLLNKILVIEPTNRITVDGIMSHPWYNQKLSHKYQSALDNLARQQAELERHVAAQHYDAVCTTPRMLLICIALPNIA